MGRLMRSTRPTYRYRNALALPAYTARAREWFAELTRLGSQTKARPTRSGFLLYADARRLVSAESLMIFRYRRMLPAPSREPHPLLRAPQSEPFLDHPIERIGRENTACLTVEVPRLDQLRVASRRDELVCILADALLDALLARDRLSRSPASKGLDSIGKRRPPVPRRGGRSVAPRASTTGEDHDEHDGPR